MTRPLLRTLLVLSTLTLPACGGAGRGTVVPDAPPPATEVTSTLEIHGAHPAQGVLAGGAPLRIEGRGFLVDEPLWVRVGSRLLQVRASSDAFLDLVAPPGDMAGPVVVGVASASARATLPDGYAYSPMPPRGTFAPCVGAYDPGRGGTLVTIRLEHAPPLVAPRVRFGNREAASVVRIDERVLVAEVPPGLFPGVALELLVEQDGWTVLLSGFRVQGTLVGGDVVVNEFLADAGETDANGDGFASRSGDEFVEVVNRLGVPVDLSGFTLHDGAALRHRFPNPTSIPARGVLVLFGFGTPRGFAPLHESGHAQAATSGGLGLNNGGDEIRLVAPAGTEVLRLAYEKKDVEAGRSRNNRVDGGLLPADAGSSDYAWHDEVSGAVGLLSPGRRVDGSTWP